MQTLFIKHQCDWRSTPVYSPEADAAGAARRCVPGELHGVARRLVEQRVNDRAEETCRRALKRWRSEAGRVVSADWLQTSHLEAVEELR